MDADDGENAENAQEPEKNSSVFDGLYYVTNIKTRSGKPSGI